MTYKITRKTNSWIANRNYKGRTMEVIDSGLTLAKARETLLGLYNHKYEGERPYATNWGLAVIQSRPYVEGANKTSSDGTRSFSWDSRTYSIEEEEV